LSTQAVSNDIIQSRLEPGTVVRVRSRRYLVVAVEPAREPSWEQTLVDLSCLEDDAQGERLSVLWEREPDAQILPESNWKHLASKGFDAPHVFSAYLHALRWNLVTSTNQRLFQSPHRAGIQIMSYQLEPLKKALQMLREGLAEMFTLQRLKIPESLHKCLATTNIIESLDPSGAISFVSRPAGSSSR